MVGWTSLFLAVLAAGTILHQDPNFTEPIEVSITNQDSLAEYYFNFYTSVTLEVMSTLNVVFPSEFETVSTSEAYYVTSKSEADETNTSATFAIASNTLTVTLPVAVEAGTSFSIKAIGVKNPLALTSTGAF